MTARWTAGVGDPVLAAIATEQAAIAAEITRADGKYVATTGLDAATAPLVTGNGTTATSLRAAFVPQVMRAISRLTVLGHSYAMGDKNTRAGGWLGTGSITAGSTAIASGSTLTGTAAIGQTISGAGIPDGATVTAVTGGIPTVISLPASATRTPANLSAGAVREARWSGRLAAALGAKERNYARNGSIAWLQGGTGNDQGGYSTALQELTPTLQAAPYMPAHQVVAIMHGINDLGTYDNPARLSHILRLMASRARAAAVFEESHSSIVYGGGTWTNGTASYNSGGGNKTSPTPATGATITVTMPSDFPTGAVASFVFSLTGDNQSYTTAGVYQFARGGTTLATLDTRNITGATTNVMEACQRIGGLAAGDVVTITFPTAPTGFVFFDCWMIEAPAAPLVLLLKQPLLTSTGYSAYSTTPITDARVQAFNTSLDALAAEFTDGMVVTVDLSILDHATAKMASDQLHPNEQGHADIAGAVLNAIVSSPLTRAAVLAGAGQRGY